MVSIQAVTHWTDSIMMLQGLQPSHKYYQVFEAMRVGEIRKQSMEDEW